MSSNLDILSTHNITNKASAMDQALRASAIATDFAPPFPGISHEDIASFRACLASSSRILLFLGAGLSAPSGIPTFRGPNTSWRGLSPKDISSPYFFEENPVLFWHHFNHRRSMAMKARPNAGHFALMELAGKWGRECLAVNQNIDGLSQRAGHAEGIVNIHGSLFETECNNPDCDYAEANYDTDPIVPDLAVTDDLDISDPVVALPPTTQEQLPRCPICGALMRPSVVLFTEKLYQNAVDEIEQWLEEDTVDLVLVVGTNASVYPAVGYLAQALETGARVAIVNIAPLDDQSVEMVGEEEWYFRGSAEKLLPLLLKDFVQPMQI